MRERRVGKFMILASKDLAVSQPDRARVRVRLKGTCTAEEGLDAQTFRGFHLAGELFLLTSFFIEPEGGEFSKRNLEQIPRLGPIRVALLIALLQTPHRFRTKRQLWNYCCSTGWIADRH